MGDGAALKRLNPADFVTGDFGLPTVRKIRWCGGCAKGHSAINLSKQKLCQGCGSRWGNRKRRCSNCGHANDWDSLPGSDDEGSSKSESDDEAPEVQLQ